MDIGTELREARQRAGLTAQQVADRTKIRLEKIKALEQNAFEHLPAGIFLDGMVKAYAYEVGYDARAALRRLHGEEPNPNLDGWVSEADLPRSQPASRPAAQGTAPVVKPAVPRAAQPATAQVVRPAAPQVEESAAPRLVTPAIAQVVKPPSAPALKPATAQVVTPPIAPIAKPPTADVVKPPTAEVVKPPAPEVLKPPTADVVNPSSAEVAKPAAAPILQVVPARLEEPAAARVVEPPAARGVGPAEPVAWRSVHPTAAHVVQPAVARVAGPAAVPPGVPTAAGPARVRRGSGMRTAAFALLGLFAATGWGLYLYSMTRTDDVRDAAAPSVETPVAAPTSDAVRSTRPTTQSEAAERAAFGGPANDATQAAPGAASTAAATAPAASTRATAQRTAALPVPTRTVAAVPPASKTPAPPSAVKSSASAAPASTSNAASVATPTSPGASAPLPAAAIAPASPTADLPDAPAPPLRAAGGVSGAWDLTTHVLSTNNERDKGRRLGYRVELVQNGNRVVGKGYKITENGQAISPDDRITLQGTIDGRELVLTVTEQGALRSTSGQFVLSIGDDATLRGSFASDAARSRGTIYARRQR